MFFLVFFSVVLFYFWSLNNFFIYYIADYLVILIINIILSLIITIVIATLTLVERKVLSLVQRRVGPNQVGFRGRLQFIADALKLLLKGITAPELTNKKFFVFVPAVALFVCYTFWINTLWGPSLSITCMEYNIVYLGIMSIFFTLCVVLTGVFSRNKYTVLAAVRSCVMAFNLEVMLGFLFIFLVSINESFSFAAASSSQNLFFYSVFLLLPLCPFIIIVFLLETNRAPFDLAEAESELVAGYTTELGGFFFALFYLGEYFHLYFFSFTVSVLLLGGAY